MEGALAITVVDDGRTESLKTVKWEKEKENKRQKVRNRAAIKVTRSKSTKIKE